MIDNGTPNSFEAPVEAVLRDALAQGDVALGAIAQILGHLLANHDHSMFSDETVARVRGMVSHIAYQLLMAQGEAAGQGDPDRFAREHSEGIAAILIEHSALLTHCHALATEWQVTVQLEGRDSIDPVLSPLLQALIASDDGATAALAMTALASQVRFIQQNRRMELPLGELPGDLFHQILTIWRGNSGAEGSEFIVDAETKLRTSFDESTGRLGLLSRLVTGMGGGATAALSISHAGFALFISTLAMLSNQNRDVVAVSTNDGQMARFALALRAAGLDTKAVEQQFLHIHPDLIMPDVFDLLRPDRAASMLATSDRNTVG
jgi:hypothetical protein